MKNKDKPASITSHPTPTHPLPHWEKNKWWELQRGEHTNHYIHKRHAANNLCRLGNGMKSWIISGETYKTKTLVSICFNIGTLLPKVEVDLHLSLYINTLWELLKKIAEMQKETVIGFYQNSLVTLVPWTHLSTNWNEWMSTLKWSSFAACLEQMIHIHIHTLVSSIVHVWFCEIKLNPVVVDQKK